MREYRIKNVLYRLAIPEDDAVLKRLLHQNPMESWVNITTEREPSYFAGASLMGETYPLIAHNEEKVIGMYSCSYLPVHIDGKGEMIGYLGGLRLESEFRHTIHYVRNGFEAIKKIVPERATVPFYFTSISSENHTARRLLEANTRGMPHYSPVGEMTTMIFSTVRERDERYLVQAQTADIADIVSFYNDRASSYQFSPRLSEEWLSNPLRHPGLEIADFWLLRDEKHHIRCCLALWDQRPFKQSVVKGYKPPLNTVRKLYNLYARMSGRVELPPSGEALEHLYITFFACDSDDMNLTINLLKEAAHLAQAKGVKCCVIGFSSLHPHLPALKNALKPEIYRTQIETVTLNGEPRCPLSSGVRMVQPEVALL